MGDMAPFQDPKTFWQSSDFYIATNPSRADDAKGLADFAASTPDTRSLLFFQTSGSEGSPKWVGLTREGCIASAQAVNVHLEATDQDRWLIALPLHHVGGFSIMARCFVNGASFTQSTEKWNPARFQECCATQKITLASLVPTQVFDLVQARLTAPSTLRAIVVGGGALAKDVGLRAQELGWPVLQSYGMTETASQIATEPLDHLYQGFDPERLEVLPLWDLMLDEEDTLTVRGPALAKGYAIKQSGAWQWQSLDALAGLRTRDRAQIWSHGSRRFLRFVGREASFVKVLGELVNVAALQSRLENLALELGLPSNQVVIWPMPDDRRETKLILIGKGSEFSMESLRLAFNEKSLGPERLYESHVVEKIPRTGLGKLDRGSMTKLVEEFR